MNRLSLLALSLITLASCTGNGGWKRTPQTAKGKDTVKVSQAPIPSAPEKDKWQYATREDQLHDLPVKTASLPADNILNFDFPYNGGTQAQLTIRKSSSGTDVFIIVDKGQFNSSFDGGSVTVRFDKGKAREWSFVGASDNSSNIIFLVNEISFIKKLKASKKLIVQAEFYREGNHQMLFDTAGLKW